MKTEIKTDTTELAALLAENAAYAPNAQVESLAQAYENVIHGLLLDIKELKNENKILEHAITTYMKI